MAPTTVDSRKTGNKRLVCRAEKVLLLGCTWSSTFMKTTSKINEEENLRNEKSLDQCSSYKLLSMFPQCTKVACRETPMTTVQSLTAYFCSISIPEDLILILTFGWRYSTRKWPHEWNWDCSELKLNKLCATACNHQWSIVPSALDAAKADDSANVKVRFTVLSQTVEIMTMDVENLTLAFAPGRLAVLVP